MAKTNGEDEAVLLLPQLPNDIIRRILPLIPTKSAFRISLFSNQFEGAWCSGPEIDLDEGNPDGGINFTNVLKRYLKFRTEGKDLRPDQSLFKFRVRMAMDDPIREDILEKLLICFAKERSIKVLDLSCLTIPARLSSLQTLINIKSLTSLSLESVRIKGDAAPYVRLASSSDLLLPFLKSMSLKSMQLPHSNFSDMLVTRCPSIENLSVISCCFDLEYQQNKFSIPHSATLKCLELRDCNFRYISVDSCWNLETFTSVSESPVVEELSLGECDKLEKIEILEKHLESIDISFLDNKTLSLKIKVDTPNLTSFTLDSEDMRHKCIDGQGSFTHFFEYYYILEEYKSRRIDPSSLFR
uniref:putative FBD-associated F-box protein At5g56690 n=1 Tax=Fragaria vesca subsp. vesca TaxID=101020 RepID=UPI0005C866A6|nr:PREDICTED: putative FBD-associated F-box protein At5g56690 [Fragaria vesca subsp. vesca]